MMDAECMVMWHAESHAALPAACMHACARKIGCTLLQALAAAARQETPPSRGSVPVQRHALDEHVPALQGPLRVQSAEGEVPSFLEWARGDDDEAAALCTIWCGALSAPRSHLPLALLAAGLDILSTRPCNEHGADVQHRLLL